MVVKNDAKEIESFPFIPIRSVIYIREGGEVRVISFRLDSYDDTMGKFPEIELITGFKPVRVIDDLNTFEKIFLPQEFLGQFPEGIFGNVKLKMIPILGVRAIDDGIGFYAFDKN